MRNKFNWIAGSLVYSLGLIFVPGLILILGDFLIEILKKISQATMNFGDLPWVIKILILILVGVCIQWRRPLYTNDHTNESLKYKNYRERFRRMTDEELLKTYRDDKRKPGWTNSRSYFYAGLNDEFEKRNIKKPL